MNIHGAIDPATGQTVIIERMMIDAASTIKLLHRVEAANPTVVQIASSTTIISDASRS